MDFGATFNGETAAAVARRQGHADIAFLLNIARSNAALSNGVPTPFDGPKNEAATLATDSLAVSAVAAWRKAGVPDADLRRLRADLDALLLGSTMTSDAFNLRYREFFQPRIAVEDDAARRQVARLRNTFSSQ